VADKESTEVAGVRLTSPEKILYPEQGITKRQLAEYYLAVAEAMLPHVARRPITLVRCPTGRQRKCFYQRHAGSGVPAELGEVDIPGFEDSGAYLFIKDAPGLVALVQMGVLEVHPWGARVDKPDRPDRVIFDLDPGEGLGFADVAEAAHEVRAYLGDLGLASFAKTTGGKGVHVVVPVDRRYGYAQVKAFAKKVAESLAAKTPTRYLTRISKAERRGRIFIDYLRNDATSTAVAAYSTRSRGGGPVGTAGTWDEPTPPHHPAALTVNPVPGRLAKIGGDPWREMGKVRQGL